MDSADLRKRSIVMRVSVRRASPCGHRRYQDNRRDPGRGNVPILRAIGDSVDSINIAHVLRLKTNAPKEFLSRNGGFFKLASSGKLISSSNNLRLLVSRNLKALGVKDIGEKEMANTGFGLPEGQTPHFVVGSTLPPMNIRNCSGSSPRGVLTGLT